MRFKSRIFISSYFTLPLICGFAGATPSHGMDLVRLETQTDAAVQKYGVSGAGVVVAILDRGIDWAHPDFIKPDGTTRIKWLLDMTGQNLCPGSPPAVEYTEAQINTALMGGAAIPSRDAVGHGTVTAGIAAGNGLAFANGKYRGIAPEADLIIVKLTSEGAPAHDGEPAETAFQGCIDEALDWLDQKINQLGQPCVGLINSGTQWGPIDGTSAVSRKIDEIFGPDRPGRIYVSPSGDEGALPTHAGGDYTNTGDTVVQMIKNSTTTAFMQMWYTGSQPAQITITFNDGTTVGPVGPGGFLDQSGIFIIQYAPGQQFYPWQSTSGDRAIWIRIIGHSGVGSVRIRGTSSGTGRFDLYHPGLAPVINFTNHISPGRLTDYSSTFSAIVSAAHVNRHSYTDIDNILRFVNTEGTTGQLWAHSAGGPTRDGREPGVDLSAPGHNCFAAYAPDSYWATFRSRLIQDGGGWYGRAGATSGSAPIIVGAVALMLEIHPNMTADDARQILRDTAIEDGFTGLIPNNNWGFGKLDVLAALDEVNLLCAGDFDCDGSIGFDDLDVFIAVLLGLDTDAVHIARADMNGDGDADGDDIQTFVDRLQMS